MSHYKNSIEMSVVSLISPQTFSCLQKSLKKEFSAEAVEYQGPALT